MNYTLLLIVIAGLIISVIVTYLFESWRYNRFVSSLDSKSYFNQLISGYSRIVYIAVELIISLAVICALAVPFISWFDLSGDRNDATLFRGDQPSAEPSMKNDIVSQVQPSPDMPSSLPYTLQVGAFEHSENLDKRIREIQELTGMHVFIGKAQIGDTQWYRMFVGHFLTPEEARQFGQSMVRHKIISDYLVQDKKFVQDLHAPSEQQQATTPGTLKKRNGLTAQVKHSIMTPAPVKHEPVAEERDLKLTGAGFTHRPYTIQVAAFKNIQNLDKGALEIKKSGIRDTFSGETLVNQTRWYKLYVGHFQTAQEAQQFGQSLARQKILSTYLVKRVSYTVLLGSFPSEREAREYITDKITGDIRSYVISPAEGNTDSPWFLATGVFPDKKSAEDFAADLRDRGYRLAEATRK